MRLKSHESPRKGGRNDKGRGGAARQRQLKKRSRLLVRKLKSNDNSPQLSSTNLSTHSPQGTAPNAHSPGGFLLLHYPCYPLPQKRSVMLTFSMS